jgi:hypothetical protein
VANFERELLEVGLQLKIFGIQEKTMRHISRGVTMLAGDARTIEYRHWGKWLSKVPAIRRKFIRWSEDFDPLRFNEAASVALLANAASNAGYLALTEYIAQKRRVTRGRPFRQGRCDLWVADVAEDRSWAFEFKQHFCFTNVREDTLHSWLERAIKDAREVDASEADKRFGGLIIGARADVECSDDLIARVDTIMAGMPLAYRIDGGSSSAWLAFDSVD